MAFRTAAYWKSMVNNLRGTSSFSTSAFDRNSTGGIKFKLPKGDIVPVMVAAGMICVSTSFAVYTAWHQLARAPDVAVKKSRRETVPEVVDPEQVAKDAERFVKQSFFRKIAHIQDYFGRHEDPIRGDVFNRPVRVETLKDVGVDPVAH